MQTSDKLALLGILLGGAVAMTTMALPLAYPYAPLWVWKTFFWGGLTIVAGSILFLILPHLVRGIKMIPLLMIICGILLISGGVIYHLIDKTPPKSKESPAKAIDNQKPKLPEAIANEVKQQAAEDINANALPDICVFPPRIDLHSGDWKVKTPITIRNRDKDRSVYAVWVEIEIEDNSVPSESVAVEYRESPKIEGHIGDFLVSGDLFGLVAIDSGHEAVFIILRKLSPATEIELIVSGTAPVESHATVKVVSFSTKEMPMLERKDGAALSFTPPKEGILPKGVIVILRKESGK